MDETKVERIIPFRLQRRIHRLINIDDILTDHSATPEEQSDPIQENDSEIVNNDIFIEPRLQPKPLHVIKTNWIERFCETNQKDRIIWDSKLYKEARQFENKTMYEQVEELMDISAEDFAECINKLTDDEQHQISKEMIKKLFSIEIESDISHSMFVNKVQKPYVSEEIAEMFECPELAIERNIRRLMKENKKATRIKPKYHAFGRSLSPTSKRVQKTKFTEPEPFEFPEDIRSGENLFKGIDHLKTTKELMKYLDEHNLRKPKYLVKMNALNPKSSDIHHTPLHSFYQ